MIRRFSSASGSARSGSMPRGSAIFGKVAPVDHQQACGAAPEARARGRRCTSGKHALESPRSSRKRPREVLDCLRDAPLTLGMLAQLHCRETPGALVQKTGGTLQISIHELQHTCEPIGGCRLRAFLLAELPER